MPEIFINYRRSDSSGYTGRISDKLRYCFGANQIFRDYETLGIGVQFKHEIQEAILASSVVLVIIGPEWTMTDINSGKMRLENEQDFVRFEIELALSNGIPIIPVLVGGAQMPAIDILPISIKKLSGFNAHQLTETHWNADIDSLIQVLSSKTGLESIETTQKPSQHPYWLSGLLPLFYIVPDFLSLFRGPIKFLRRRSFGRPKDLLNALVFFTMIVIISDILLYMCWEPEHRSFWSFIFLGIPTWLIVTLLVSFPLWLSWWLVGARDHYQRTITVLFYQVSVAVMIFFISGIIMISGLEFQDPDLIQKGFEILKNPDLTDKSERVTKMMQEAFVGVPAFIASGLGLGLLVSLPIWLIVSWRGYRIALNRPRWASFLAFPIFIVVLSGPLVFFAWLG